MIVIRHRRNTVEELRATPTDLGVEIDLRTDGELIVHHDPFVAGESFADWLRVYAHRFLILNVKEEGLEDRLLALMAEHKVEDFFFLDQSFPFLVKTAKTGEKRCAVRVSEFESVDTAMSLAGKVGWIWVDCFTRFPLDGHGAHGLQAAGFKLCLVSPELQGRPLGEIEELKILLQKRGIAADAVCTKEPDLWA